MSDIPEDTTTMLTERFAAERAALASGKTVEEALALGEEFAKSWKPATPEEKQSRQEDINAALLKGAPTDQIMDLQQAKLDEAVVEHYRAQHGLSPELTAEIAENRPVTAQEHKLAQEWLDRTKRDQAFVKRWLDGEPEAGRKMFLAQNILSRPIAQEKAA